MTQMMSSESPNVTKMNASSGSGVNTAYIKSIPGILQILELIFSIMCVTILGYYTNKSYQLSIPLLFFVSMTVFFIVGNLCFLTTCFVSSSTAAWLSKTIYLIIYNTCACILYSSASLTLLIDFNTNGSQFHHILYLIVSITGYVVAVFYLASTILAVKKYNMWILEYNL